VPLSRDETAVQGRSVKKEICLMCRRPPFVFIDGSRTGNAAFYGFLVDLLPLLFQTAGLGNYTLQYYNSTNEGGERLQNGTWTGKPQLYSPFLRMQTILKLRQASHLQLAMCTDAATPYPRRDHG
jgi:hypothetical protein